MAQASRLCLHPITYLPLHAHARGLTHSQIALVFAIQALINAVSRLPFGWGDRVRHRSYLVVAGLLGIAVSLAGYGLSRRPLHFNLAAVAMGISMGLAFTSVVAFSIETVRPEFRGLAMGGYNSSHYLGMMVSSAGLGPHHRPPGLSKRLCPHRLDHPVLTVVSAFQMEGLHPPQPDSPGA